MTNNTEVIIELIDKNQDHSKAMFAAKTIHAAKSDIKINIRKEGETNDWGDEDCQKLVTEILSYEITISESLATQITNDLGIWIIRYGYYAPAYKFKNPEHAIIINNPDKTRTYRL